MYQQGINLLIRIGEVENAVCHRVLKQHGALYLCHNIIEKQRQHVFAKDVFLELHAEPFGVAVLNGDDRIAIVLCAHILHAVRVVVIHDVFKRIENGTNYDSFHGNSP